MKILPVKTEIPLLARRPHTFVGRYCWALLALVIAATADAVTTYVNLARYGTGIEVHPVQRFVFDTFGIAAGVPVAKVLQVGFVLFVAA